MKRILAVAATSSAVLLALVAPATAGGGDGTSYDHSDSGHGVGVSGTQQQAGQGGTQQTGGTWTPPSQWTETSYVPTCARNSPTDGDAMCMAAVTTCPDPQTRFWVYTRTVYADGRKPTPWAMQPGSVCRGPDQPAIDKPKVTGAMVTQAAEALAPALTVHVQPAAQSYVAVPNNFYADAPTVTRTVTLFGHAIAITFKPGDVQWDFGDGATGSGAGIKDAAVGEPGAVEHAYRVQGSYDITAVSHYAVSFTLPDGQAVTTDVAGMPSPAQQLDIGEVQTVVRSAG